MPRSAADWSAAKSGAMGSLHVNSSLDLASAGASVGGADGTPLSPGVDEPPTHEQAVNRKDGATAPAKR